MAVGLRKSSTPMKVQGFSSQWRSLLRYARPSGSGLAVLVPKSRSVLVMLHVSDLYALSPTAIGTKVQVSGVLLGGGFDLFVADSIEGFDMGIAVPIFDDE